MDVKIDQGSLSF